VTARSRHSLGGRLELVEEVFDEVGGGDDADEFGAVDDGDGVEVALGEDFGGFANGGGLLEEDGAFGHDVFECEGVVEGGVDGAFVGVEGVAEADAEDVGEGDDADELVAIDDGDVVDAAFFDDLADFGDGVAVVDGGDIGGHDFGDGFVALHGGQWVWLVGDKRFPVTAR